MIERERLLAYFKFSFFFLEYDIERNSRVGHNGLKKIRCYKRCKNHMTFNVDSKVIEASNAFSIIMQSGFDEIEFSQERKTIATFGTISK